MVVLSTERDYFIYNLNSLDFEDKADEVFDELSKQ